MSSAHKSVCDWMFTDAAGSYGIQQAEAHAAACASACWMPYEPAASVNIQSHTDLCAEDIAPQEAWVFTSGDNACYCLTLRAVKHKLNCPPAEGNATDVGGGGVPTRASSDYTGEFGLHRRVRPGRWRNGAGPLAQWSRAAPRIPKASPPNRWSIMAASLQKRSKMIENDPKIDGF